MADGSAFHEDWEVVVVGGGPGGSTAAARLAQRGRRVLLLERERFPRFHIGESLLPASAPLLRDLGVEEELDRRFVRKHGARFLDDGATDLEAPEAQTRYVFADAFPPSTPWAWQVPRDEFDDLLLRNASRLGAVVRQGVRVRAPITGTDAAVKGVEVEDESGALRRIGARVVVDATGRESLLARLQRERSRIPGLDKTAVFTQVRGGHRNPGDAAGQIELVILEGKNADGGTPGWAWFIPFKDGRSSAGFVLSSDVVRAQAPDARAEVAPGLLAHPREYEARRADSTARLEAVFDGQLARSPWMRKLLRDAPRIEPVRAAADYSFRVDEIVGDGWLAVGDAAGFLDPLFSTGAHLALGSADRAAAEIDAALREQDFGQARFAAYQRAVRAAAELFLGAVQSFYRGELRELLFAQDQRAVLRRTITSMLAGDVFHDESDRPRWVSFLAERFPVAR